MYMEQKVKVFVVTEKWLNKYWHNEINIIIIITIMIIIIVGPIEIPYSFYEKFCGLLAERCNNQCATKINMHIII